MTLYPVRLLEAEARAALRLRARLGVRLQSDDDLAAFLQGAADDLAEHPVGQPDANVDRRRPAGVVEHPDAPARGGAAGAAPARGHLLIELPLLGRQDLGDTRARFRAQALRLTGAFRRVLGVERA